MCELKCRQSHDCYVHAKDESKEIADTRHLKFNRGVDSSFHVHEELHNSRSFKDATTTGEGLFLRATKIASLELSLKKLRCVNRRWQEYVQIYNDYALTVNNTE